MAVRDVLIAPHPTLRSKSKPVAQFTLDLHALLDDMYESMVAYNGIGLAAPQVGVSQQVAIIDVSGDYIEQPVITSSTADQAAQHIHNRRLEIINPRIIATDNKDSSEEGCLSIPDYRDTITRPSVISVEAYDRRGRAFTFTARDLLAFAVQHEIDHLHGILYVDHLSRLKKTLFRKWAVKNLGSADI